MVLCLVVQARRTVGCVVRLAACLHCTVPAPRRRGQCGINPGLAGCFLPGAFAGARAMWCARRARAGCAVVVAFALAVARRRLAAWEARTGERGRRARARACAHCRCRRRAGRERPCARDEGTGTTGKERSRGEGARALFPRCGCSRPNLRLRTKPQCSVLAPHEPTRGAPASLARAWHCRANHGMGRPGSGVQKSTLSTFREGAISVITAPLRGPSLKSRGASCSVCPHAARVHTAHCSVVRQVPAACDLVAILAQGR